MDKKKIVISIFVALVSSVSAIAIVNFLTRREVVVFSDLVNVRPIVYLTAFAIFTSSYLVEALRLKVVVEMGGYRLKFSDSLVNNILGYLFSFLTPFAMGGQPFQVYHMKLVGVDTEYSTGVMMTRILQNSLGATVIALIVLNTNIGWIVKRGHIVIAGITISLFVTSFLFISMVNPHIFTPVVKVLSRIFKKENWVKDFEIWIDGFKEGVKKMWKENFKVMVLDVFGWFVALSIQIYALYYTIVEIVRKEPGFWKVFGLVNSVNALAYFIPTPGSSGGIETTYSFVLSALTDDPSKTLLAVTVWRISAFYLQIALGLSILFLAGKRLISRG